MPRFTRLPALTALVVLAAMGCADEPLTPEASAPDPSDAEAALVQAIEAITDDFGLVEVGAPAGFDESDEAPAFGNTVFADAFGALSDGNEVSADVTGEMALLPPDAREVYHVMAVWGRIRPNPNTRWSWLQWDPALEVRPRDAVRVRREILFEPGDLVHPQEARHVVKITSRTGPHVDGVIAQVVLPSESIVAADAILPSDEGFLAFSSTPYSVKVPASELAGLNLAKVIDDIGNGVMLTAVRRRPTPCAVGFMGGRWARTSDRGGVFGGLWHQADGRREGYLAGRWGVTRGGEMVFRGKLVSLRGEFLASMAGTYGDGAYEGEIYGRGGVLLGYVSGRYVGEDGHGLFQGAWRQACVTDVPPRHCELAPDGVRVCHAIVRPDSIG